MFINHTNHPSRLWSQEQLRAAHEYGEIIDIPFPDVDPCWTDQKLDQAVEENVEKIEQWKPKAVLCQGEFVYTWRLVQCLKKRQITVLAACSIRRAVEKKEKDGSTVKESVFEFVKFREY